MSVQAVAWALEQRVGDNTRKLILIAMADVAGKDGGHSFQLVSTLAGIAECSSRTVHRHLRILEDEGFIRQGDQRHVSHMRPDRRPTVYDLTLERGDTGDIPSIERGDTRGDTQRARGVTPVTERGDTAVSHITQENPKEQENTPLPPAGGQGEETGTGSSIVHLEGLGGTPVRVGTGHEPVDRLCAALVYACGYRYADMTAPDRRACAVAARQLVAVEATPDDVATRACHYAEKWPGASLTPTALARRWAACANPPRSNHPPGRKTTAMRNVAADIQAGQL